MSTPICPYCENNAVLVTGRDKYPHRPDLYSLRFWDCRPCDAFVGCHKNSKTHEPLGTLANRETRGWRMRAHRAFDHLWKSGVMTRRDAYNDLADRLGYERGAAHISWMSAEECKRVVETFGVRA